MQRVVLSCPGVTDKKWGIFDAVKNGVRGGGGGVRYN